MSLVCITGARGTTESVCLRRNRREKKPRWNPLWNDECAVKHDTIPKKRHETYLTEKHLKTLKQNIQKTLLIKGFSLREDGSIRIMDSTIVCICR